jgi:quinoprotein glucose dehydrogenase
MKTTISIALSVLISAALFAWQQPVETPEAHIERAKLAAGSTFQNLFDFLCTTPAARGGGPGRGTRAGGPPRDPPDRSTWYAEPVKVFDNLYFVGQSEYSAWALTTSEGIILFDTLFDYAVESEVAEGLKKLGLDPATIKYAVVSHPHPDHHGGAKFLQDRYRSRIVMSGPDWDVIDRLSGTKPSRDMVATDGQTITLGDTTITLYVTPGHTPGTLSAMIPVRVGRQRHIAALWGGTGLNADRPSLEAYVASAKRFSTLVQKARADIILSNHTDWDGSKANLPLLAKRTQLLPNPYVVGTPVVTRYLKVAEECASARLLRAPAPAVARATNDGGDWPTYNRDLAGTRYSPLTQINTQNVGTLTQAWSYRLRPEPGRSVPAIDTPASSFEIFQEVTPIVVNGVMYLPSGHRVVALEPETGKEIWRHELPEGLASFRGVAYWPGDGQLPARIFFTSLRKLIALRADTGALDVSFGTGGHIDLEIPYSGVPVLYRNIVLMGSNFFGPGERHIGPHLTTSRGEKGDVHAYDARTGAKAWTFHTIPQPGELGHDTWAGDSWKNRTGNNVWSFTLTVDEPRGLVYLPVSGPGMNYYGGDRPGDNLFSNSTVALDAQTGKLKWHFQNIRHEIWDYNLPPAPGLIDIKKDGTTIPALAQVGKSGFMFILNRETGAPVHGMDERPQPTADVPGEWYPKSQPIPKKPGPLARVSVTRNDLVTAGDTTAAHAEACRALWDKVRFRNDGPYTPWNYRPNGGPPSIVFPGMTGGVNWGGTATDPQLGYIFVNSKDEPSSGWIAPNPRYNEQTKDTEFPYVQQSGGTLSAEARTEDGRSLGVLPCFRPPWASLMAVNAATGEFAWRVPLGVNDAMPEGKKHVGSPGYGGPIVTAGGLVFIGATRDRQFRAFDSRTGKELWAARLDYNATAIPITYLGRNGKQYVAVVAATQGQGNNESLRVFALP